MVQPSQVLGNVSRGAAGTRASDARHRKDQFGEWVPRSSGTCRAALVLKEHCSRLAVLLPRAEPVADTPPAECRTTACNWSSGSADPISEWRGTPGCRLLRVARGEAAVLRSRRAGRSSPYCFALMLFLKERDSCEQTGLTETASTPLAPYTHTTPQGIPFFVCCRL